jgi:hypothetical protein
VQIDVPGVGHVVVNEIKIADPTSGKHTSVNGLHINVTVENVFGIPVGSRIVIAHADTFVDGRPANVRSADPDEGDADSGV